MLSMQHLLLIIPCLTLAANPVLLVEDHRLDTFGLQPACGSQACWPCANDADGMLIMMAVRLISRCCEPEESKW